MECSLLRRDFVGEDGYMGYLNQKQRKDCIFSSLTILDFGETDEIEQGK